MDLPFYVPFIIMAAVAGFAVQIKAGLPPYLKLLPYFLLLTFMLELFAWQMITRGNRTAPYYNFTSVINFVFFFYIIRQIIRGNAMKYIIIICMIIYPLIAFANIFLFQGINDFNTMSYSLGALFTIIFCVYFFYELFTLPHSINLKTHPGFWFVTGLLFFNACTLPLIGLANYIYRSQFSPVLINNFQNILNVLNVLLYLLFTIAFLCRISFQRSIS